MATQQKQKVFVYGRKEVIVLAGLSIWVAAFAFTLGVHLGKKVSPTPKGAAAADAESASTVGDMVPNRQEIQEQAKGLIEGVDETVAQELQEEVTKEGMKLAAPRQVVLPEHSKSANAGATTLHSAAHDTHGAKKSAAFLLQVGSFPSLADAETEMKALEAQGLKPFLKQADLKGKQWYRLYLGGYESSEQAQAAGKNYQDKQWIKSFIVARSHD